MSEQHGEQPDPIDTDLPGKAVAAVQEAVSAMGAMPGRIMCLVEVIDSQGGVGVIIGTSENLRTWDALGLLRYAETIGVANVHRNMP